MVQLEAHHLPKTHGGPEKLQKPPFTVQTGVVGTAATYPVSQLRTPLHVPAELVDAVDIVHAYPAGSLHVLPVATAQQVWKPG